MPAEQTLGGECVGAMQGGIEHHLDHAFNVPIHRRDRPDVHAQAARDGGAYRFHVQQFTFDFAGLDHVLGQRGKTGLITQRQPHIGQTPQQKTLSAADLGQWPRKQRQVVAPVRPIVGLPDVEFFTAIHAEIRRPIRRMVKLFTAHYAVNMSVNRRIGRPRVGGNGCSNGCSVGARKPLVTPAWDSIHEGVHPRFHGHLQEGRSRP